MSYRTFKLSEPEAKVHRVLSGQVTVPGAEKNTSWVTVTRVGSFTDPRYGRFEITPAMLLSMVKNFESKVYGQEIFLDVNHIPGNGSAAKVMCLSVEGNRLRALVEWTPFGLEAVKKRGFAYLSAEYVDNFQDNEAGMFHGPTLLGAGLTVRPVIKHLDPVTLSCEAGGDVKTFVLAELAEEILIKARANMDAIKQLKKKLSDLGYSDAVITKIIKLAEACISDDTPADKVLATVSELEGTAKTLAESEAAATQAASQPQGNTSVNQGVTLSKDDIANIVSKQLAELEQNTRQQKADREAQAKKLAATIMAAVGLPDDVKKKLAEDAEPLLMPGASDEHIAAVAANQIQHGHSVVAARQLSDMGYQVGGTPHISTPDSTVKKLSQIYQDNLRRSGASLVLAEKTTPFVEKVLSEFDRVYGPQLAAEHKILASGETGTANTQLPYGVIREVIREALHDLNVLQLVQTLTDFSTAQTTNIPYEMRQMGGVLNDGLVFEGQPIPFAGIEQRMDMAYVNQMKLALSVTNEVIHFTRASAINWDALSRNIETNARIMRELVARRIINEIQRVSDSFNALVVEDESVTASGTGVFKTANWPVVRPYQAVNLLGDLIGAPEHPLVVKSASTEIGAFDGSGKQSAGTYFRIVDLNQGVFQFVDQTGAPKGGVATPTISYSYATNVIKFDLDVPAGSTLEKHLNGLLRAVGSRKAMMSGQRYENPNFALMSPVLNDQITNAEQFISSLKRDGSDTTVEGDLGKVKNIAVFGTNAPHTDMGDGRIILGVRGTTSYTIAKPFATGELIEATDAQGRPLGKKVANGEEYNAIHTPKPIRGRYTSIVAYSKAGRDAA